MNWTVPTHIRDGDRLTLRRSEADDARTVYTFVDALNQGTLFERPPSVFRNGAVQHRLFELINATMDDTLIGTIIVQDNSIDETTKNRESELGGLVIHPGARGQRLAGVLTRIALLHDMIKTRQEGWNCEYQAHFVEGNEGPETAFRETGFLLAGETSVHRGDVDASLESMLKPGEDSVLMKRLVFDEARLGDLISWYGSVRQNDMISPVGQKAKVHLDLGALVDEMKVEALKD